MHLEFPDSFLWGAATSAHQVEGDNKRSDWWQSEVQGRVPFASGNACEQYSRFSQDFSLSRAMGHNAHRMSIEWSRIEPDPGVFDETQMEHYVDVLSSMREHGLSSYVTLHHFTNPLWFAERGGWTSPEAPALFERYVGRVAERLAPLVDYWITLNEPSTIALQGYLTGAWPPHFRGAWIRALRAMEIQAQAHICAYRRIHQLVPGARVGYTYAFINWQQLKPQSAVQTRIAHGIDQISNYRFCDRVGQSTDFIGVQYYFTLLAGLLPRRPGSIEDAIKTDIGWDIAPDGLRSVLMNVWRRYGIPIHVTENGLADAQDTRRERFILDHLRALHSAISEGVDVRGYLHWSLLDNFEWAMGYAPRFGLVSVDYATQERVPRPSAHAYAQVIARNGFDWEEQVR